jgi:hypothetical protein
VTRTAPTSVAHRPAETPNTPTREND